MSGRTEIPVIDVSGWLAGERGAENTPDKIDSIYRDLGFFVITGHGIEAKLIRDLRAVCTSFFTPPEEVKAAYQPPVGPDTSRLSIVYFHQPNYDALIETLPTCCDADNPSRYDPVTSGEHLMRKAQLQREMASY